MSFILDALKKSESQRQRADAPALYEMKMAPVRQGVPTWLIVLGALLIINIIVLSVVLLRGNHGAPPQADANNGAAPLVATPPPPAAAPVAAAPLAVNPPVAAAPSAPTSIPDNALNGAVSTSDSADDAPAVESAATPPDTGGRGGVTRSAGVGTENVPTYEQAASTPGANLPQLKLDLHAYATNPADRFVFLNMVKLREGQTTPTGVRVEAITPDGAILSWQGSRFFLQRQ